MAITEYVVGSETVGTTEHSLTTDSAGPDVDATVGIYQAFVDLAALAAGDRFEFRLYETVVTTQRLAYREVFQNAQTEPIFDVKKEDIVNLAEKAKSSKSFAELLSKNIAKEEE